MIGNVDNIVAELDDYYYNDKTINSFSLLFLHQIDIFKISKPGFKINSIFHNHFSQSSQS